LTTLLLLYCDLAADKADLKQISGNIYINLKKILNESGLVWEVTP